MKKIVIIGAGAMGSAFAVPCADNSNEVFLVGSFLEDKIINEIKHLNNFHPILKSQLPKNIKVLKFSEFKDEIKDNIDLLVVGVSSKGIQWIGNEISKFYNSSIDILLLTKGLALINDKFDIQMLVISKTLRSTYKDPESIAHKVLADRMGERDPGNKPQSNDRIPYVYIKYKTTGKAKVLQGDKIEHVNFVRDNKLKPDYVTYLENQIMKPVSQIYELVIHKLDGFTKAEDYFERLEERYYEKYADKSEDFIHDKIQQKKQEEVEKLLFQDALRKAHNQKDNLQEISSWLVIDENSNFINSEPVKVNKKSPTSQQNIVRKQKTNRSITDWLTFE